MFDQVLSVNRSLLLLNEAMYLTIWQETLERLLDNQQIDGKIRGAATRILLDNETLKVEQAVGILGYALSKSVDIGTASSWLNGFLYGSGLLLIHNPALWEIVDDWVSGLNDDQFQQMLPALRRTFAAFAPAERQKMLQLVRDGQLTQRPTIDTTLDTERVKIILPMLQLFFDD